MCTCDEGVETRVGCAVMGRASEEVVDDGIYVFCSVERASAADRVGEFYNDLCCGCV